MLQLQLKQTTHYGQHLRESNKTNNLLNCLTIFKCWQYTHNAIPHTRFHTSTRACKN